MTRFITFITAINQALKQAESRNYTPRTHTLEWVQNLVPLGQVWTVIGLDTALYPQREVILLIRN